MSAVVREGVLLGLLGAVSVLCLLYGLLVIVALTRQEPKSGTTAEQAARREMWQFVVASACLVLAFYAVTLPKKQPFSPGQTLGLGFLIGGAIAIVAHLMTQSGISRLRRCPVIQAAHDAAAAERVAAIGGAAISLGLFGLGLGTVAGVFVLFHSYPNDALIGLSLGVCLVTFIGRLASQPSAASGGAVGGAGLPLDIFSAWVATLSVTTLLGMDHYYESFVKSLNVMVSREVWIGPMTLGAVWLLASFFGAWVVVGRHSSFHASPPTRAPRWGRAAVVQVLLACALAYFVCVRIFGYRPPFWPLSAGLLTSALTAWISASFLCPRDEGDTAFLPRGAVEAALLVALALLGALLFSYRSLSNYGVSLCALGWVGFAPWTLAFSLAESISDGTSASSHRARATALVVHLSGLMILTTALFRLFLLQQSLTEYRINIYNFDVFIGMALGALMVWKLGWLGIRTYSAAFHMGSEMQPTHHGLGDNSGGNQGRGAGAAWLPLGFSLLTGLSTLAGPAFVLLFWGMKALAAVLIGALFGALLLLVAGCVLLPTTSSAPRFAFGVAAAVVSPVLLGMHLAAVQFAGLLETAGVLKRVHKIELVAGFVLLWVLWSALVGRRSRNGTMKERSNGVMS